MNVTNLSRSRYSATNRERERERDYSKYPQNLPYKLFILPPNSEPSFFPSFILSAKSSNPLINFSQFSSSPMR